VSGKIQNFSPNYPNLRRLYAGNDALGWSYGDYDGQINSDLFGTILQMKADQGFFAIPLPTDLVPGDIVKICGHAWSSNYLNLIDNQFNVGVGYIKCSDITEKNNTSIFTLIPTFQTSFYNGGVACFFGQVNINLNLPACDTMLVVGMIGSDDSEALANYKFTYTLDAIKYCGGSNLLVRYCCDPAYTEIIPNNGAPVGSAFMDSGNCWTVVEETTLPITRGLKNQQQYVDCATCLLDYACQANYVVESCCGIPEQIFVPVMPGVSVGSSFVDTYGNCWSVYSTAFTPITNVVTASTVYPSGCVDCTDVNECPTNFIIRSCCYPELGGYTKSNILGPSYNVGDIFVDQFGICWAINAIDIGINFPTLGFLTPLTNYGGDACGMCLTFNVCPETLFYEVQNCCTEEIEIVELNPLYNVGNILAVWDSTDTNRECWRILSFSDVGPSTYSFASIVASYAVCQDCISQWLGDECPPTP
jgi:hypothetical protein